MDVKQDNDNDMCRIDKSPPSQEEDDSSKQWMSYISIFSGSTLKSMLQLTNISTRSDSILNLADQKLCWSDLFQYILFRSLQLQIE